MSRFHPVALAWEEFKASNPSAFDGRAGGVYLENRLRAAFEHGWDALSARVTDAANKLVDRP